MSKVSITLELDQADYAYLLSAANDSQMTVSEFAYRIVENYLEDNYGEV